MESTHVRDSLGEGEQDDVKALINGEMARSSTQIRNTGRNLCREWRDEFNFGHIEMWLLGLNEEG